MAQRPHGRAGVYGMQYDTGARAMLDHTNA